MIKNVLFDLDGTLYRGREPIPGAVDAVNAVARDRKVFFLTNAATRSREQVAEKLSSMGIEATADQVYSSSYLVARHLSDNLPGRSVFLVGEEGLADELAMEGIGQSDDADIVVVGLDRKATYGKLAHAHRLIEGGADFIATNRDHAFPVEHGTMPGCGALVALIERSTGKAALSLGKPEPYMFEVASREHGLKAEESVMVGDRLDTDILMARRSGMRAVLVLSGVSRKEGIADGEAPWKILPSVASLPTNL